MACPWDHYAQISMGRTDFNALNAPLRRTSFADTDATIFRTRTADRSSPGVNLSLNGSNSGLRDMLVIMRLPENCNQQQEHVLENRIKAYGNGRDQGVRQEVGGRWQTRSEVDSS